jgi:hypothetical protein
LSAGSIAGEFVAGKWQVGRKIGARKTIEFAIMHLTSFELGKTIFKPRNTRNTRKETGFRVFRVFRG